MTTIELKKQLIDSIQNTKDKRLLQEAYRLLQPEVIEDEVFVLNHEQKNAIQEAREQYGKGEFLSEKQANEEIDQWLNK